MRLEVDSQTEIQSTNITYSNLLDALLTMLRATPGQQVAVLCWSQEFTSFEYTGH